MLIFFELKLKSSHSMYVRLTIVYLTLKIYTASWASLSDGLDTAVDDPTILLDRYQLPTDGCLALVNIIVQGTACIVSGGSFNPDSSLGPASTSALVLVLSTNYETKFYAKGNNWVTG